MLSFVLEYFLVLTKCQDSSLFMYNRQEAEYVLCRKPTQHEILSFTIHMRAAPWGHCDDILSKRRDRRSRNLHLKRILDSKPLVDSNAPTTLGLGHSRSKQLLIKKNEKREIAFGNRKLREKLNAIFRNVRKSTKLADPSRPLLKGEANHNKTSLNKFARQKEQNRIKQENRLFKTRINK